jgi:hypothetical protein
MGLWLMGGGVSKVKKTTALIKSLDGESSKNKKKT